MRYVCLLAAVSLLPLTPASAEIIPVFRAELTCNGCNSYQDFTVELVNGNHQAVNRGVASANGAVEFRSVSAGQYFIQVSNRLGDVVHSEVIFIRRHDAGTTIRLPSSKAGTESAKGGVISVARLRHKPIKEAEKEYKKAAKKLKSKKLDEALEHLKKATEIDSEYMEAHNNLGSVYMRMNEPQQALEAFHRAAALDPTASVVKANMAVAWMSLKNYPNAEKSARGAIEIDPNDMKARYILGLSLFAQRRFTPETIGYLKHVEEQFPNARLALAQIAAQTGKVDEARAELTAYISSPGAAQRSQAEQMLSRLR